MEFYFLKFSYAIWMIININFLIILLKNIEKIADIIKTEKIIFI